MEYHINELRVGLKVLEDGEPSIIIMNECVKPGKGQAFNRVRLRKLISDKIIEKVYRSSALVKAADVVDVVLVYLYNDGLFWYFMDSNTYEQTAVNIKVINDHCKKWLVAQIECVLTLWDDEPIIVSLPNFVDLKVVSTTPNLKGDTVGSGSKFATLITGTIVKVPLFILVGDFVRVDTRSGEYISRIK